MIYFSKKAEKKWLMLWKWMCGASGEQTCSHILKFNFFSCSWVIFKHPFKLHAWSTWYSFLSSAKNPQDSFLYPQRITDLSSTTGERNLYHGLPLSTSVWTLIAGITIIPALYVNLIFFSLFLSVHGFIFMDQSMFQMIQVLSCYFLFVTGQLLP